MRREILISASDKESWVALKEDGKLTELMFDRPGQGRLVGDIFLGRVEAVLPGIQAAFVDIGEDKAGFLHASDLARDGEEESRRSGHGSRNRTSPPIQDMLSKGRKVLVKVTKEPISTKGPRVTMNMSLPGRFLVYMPDSDHIGVSRKIDHRGERTRLRDMARKVVEGEPGGVIVRTAGEELTQAKLLKEYRHLRDRWKAIQRKASKARPPASIHREAKLVSGVIRDLFTNRFDAVTIDDRKTYEQIVQYVRTFDPDLLDRIHFYDVVKNGRNPLFDHAGIEEAIRRSFHRKVDLPSGGHVIIEPTEALVSIDVNTGRFTGKKKDPEDTILKTNLDAAREIAAQLRLRDIGGIIVIDFIDMESQTNRDRVLHELRSHLGRDRARTRTWEVSELGLIEMTRQRVRPSLLQALTEPCSACGGTGRIWTVPTLIREIERCVQRAAAAGDDSDLLIRVHPQVALQVMESEPRFLRKLAKRTRMRVDMRDDPLMRHDEFRLLSGRARVDVTAKYKVA